MPMSSFRTFYRNAIMTDEQSSPAPLPPSSTPPYPSQEAPHPQRDEALKHLPEQLTTRMPEESGVAHAGIGALGVTLIGGAVAAAVGLLLAVPLLQRKPKPKAAAKSTARRAPQTRRPRRKRTES